MEEVSAEAEEDGDSGDEERKDKGWERIGNERDTGGSVPEAQKNVMGLRTTRRRSVAAIASTWGWHTQTQPQSQGLRSSAVSKDCGYAITLWLPCRRRGRAMEPWSHEAMLKNAAKTISSLQATPNKTDWTNLTATRKHVGYGKRRTKMQPWFSTGSCPHFASSHAIPEPCFHPSMSPRLVGRLGHGASLCAPRPFSTSEPEPPTAFQGC
ncbi:uncharacterized protein PAC_04356 [Phialocephala subalpina]|uniref:Uncharacterized protein n=1 Tax=Phialocephala subalpina TaxID=576137 RepID=A0A1L7WNX8_9HELO|nr:uncharacterized protein PAC_04356 [Phialocephala subalpina]